MMVEAVFSDPGGSLKAPCPGGKGRPRFAIR
jgi:hypothetical protein